MPPLSGFFAKFIVIKAGVEASSWWATGFALLVGLLTLYSMIKIWAHVFWKKPDADVADAITRRPLSKWMVLPVAALALMTVSIGLWGEHLLQIAELAAQQLLDPTGYIDAVLGEAS